MSAHGKRTQRGTGSASTSKDATPIRNAVNINGGSSSGNGSDTNGVQNEGNEDKKNSNNNGRRKSVLNNSLKNISATKLASDDSKRPRVHAQRKFAQGQGQSPSSSIQGSPAKNPTNTAVSSSQQSSRIPDLNQRGTSTMHASTGSRSGNHSSSSSTASGPVTNNTKSNGKALDTLKKGERPKTEDFLTFLCLRGTNLLPPELDFFNQAPASNKTNENSSDDESIEESGSSYMQNVNTSKQSGPMLDNGRLQSTVGGVRKSASNTSTTSRNRALASAVKKTTTPRKDVSNSTIVKKLPASVQALKKKYTEQRLARSVFTKNLQTASRRTRSQTNEPSGKEKLKSRKKVLVKSGVQEPGKRESSRCSTRNSSATDRKQKENVNRRQTKPEEARRSGRVKVVAKSIPTRKPSAAAIVAKRKTRMATLTTAASRRVSRMLTRLTPRGTSSATFVKSTLRKTKPMERQRSLRGRDISLSSEDEENDEDGSEGDEEGDNDQQNSSEKVSKSSPQKPKMKMKTRQNLIEKKKKNQESEDEDADEETSSRESSRRPSKQESNSTSNSPANKRHKKNEIEDVNRKKKTEGSGCEKLSKNPSELKHKRENRSVSRDSSGSKDSLKSERPSRKTSETAQEKRLEELVRSTSNRKGGIKKREGSSGSKVFEENDIDSKSDVDSETSRCDSNKKKNSGKLQKVLEGNKDKKKSAKNSLKQLQNLLLQEAINKIALTPGSPAVIGNTPMSGIAGSVTKNDSDTGDSDERIIISQRTGYIQVKPRKSIDQHEPQLHHISQPLETANNITSFVGTTSIPSQISQQAVLLGSLSRRLSNDGRTKTPPRKILPKTSESSNESNAITSTSSIIASRPHLPVGVMGAALSSSRISTPVVNSNQTKLSIGNNVSGTLCSTPTIPVLPIMTGSIQGIAAQVSASSQATRHSASLTQPLVINTSLSGNIGTSKVVNQTVTMANINSLCANPAVQSTVQMANPSIIMSTNGMRMPLQVAPAQMPLQIRGSISSTSGSTIPTGTVTPIQGVPIIMPTGQIALPTCNIIRPVVPNTSSICSAASSMATNSSIQIPLQQPMQQKIENQKLPVSKSLILPSTSNPPSISNSSFATAKPVSNSKKPTVKVKHQQSNSNTSSDITSNVQPITTGTSSMPSSRKLSETLSCTSVSNVSSGVSTATTSTTAVTVVNKPPLISPGPPVLSPQMKQKQLKQHQGDKNMKKSPTQTVEVPINEVASNNNPAILPQPPPILTPSGLAVTSGAVIRSLAPKHQNMRTAQNTTKTNSRTNTAVTATSSIRPSLPPPSLQSSTISQPKRIPVSEQSKHSNLVQSITSQSQTNMQKSAPYMHHVSPNAVFSASTNQHQQQLMSQQLHQQGNYLQPGYSNATQGVLVQPLHNSPFSHQQQCQNKQPIQYAYPNYAYPQMVAASQHQQQMSVPTLQHPQHILHQPPRHVSELCIQSQQKQTIQSPSHYPLHGQRQETAHLRQSKDAEDLNINKHRDSTPNSQQDKHINILNEESLVRQQSTQPIKRQEQKQMMDSIASTIKQEKPKALFSKSSSNTNLSTHNKHSPMPTSSSFRVDNEASPYAFEAEPIEVKPHMSYRKPSGSHNVSENISINKDNVDKTKESSSHHRKSDANKSKKEHHSHSKSHHKTHSKSQHQISRDKLFKGLPATVEVPDLGSSIPIPDELAAQLAEQAATGPKGDRETTYFIPLQSSSGQSFGVAVKLGTEGPAGPNQKVIMKAKLVTQPTGKPIGARVIGSQSSASAHSPGESNESEHVSPTAKKRQKRLSEGKQCQKSPKSSNEVKPKSVYYNTSSSSSSSEDEETSNDSNSSSTDSSEKESDSNIKNKNRKRKKESPTSKVGRPKGSKNKKVIKEEPSPEISLHSPSGENKLHPDPTSCTTCLGTLEALDRFPKLGQQAHLIEAPVYRPTEKEFKDPMKYIDRIRKEAQAFGMCKIIPPSSFKPELNVNDDMRFTAYNQYVNRLMNRWGPNSREMAAIKKYLDTQNVTIKPNNHPLVGGVEIDLPALYHAVQDFGGLTEVIQRKKWNKIADFLRVPKGTQDRGNKLDDVYCKFLLPYDTLSPVEREELLRLVDEEWKERKKARLRRLKREDQLKSGSDDEEEDIEEEEDSDMEDEDDDECTLKGKSTSLAAFFRVARNLMSMIFRNPNNPVGTTVAGGHSGSSNAGVVLDEEPPNINEIEEEFWRLVMERDSHVQVQQGSIDTGTGVDGFGFPTSRGSSCGRHPWNLKILSNNVRSLLRCMGAVMGVTVPTLHVGMLFTTGCWYRDPHGLPWIEYNHTGAPKVWYGVPESHSLAFYTAMKLLVPLYCHRKKVWLPSDTVMVPPNILVKHGVSVCRSVQEPGQFVVVFPRSYTSSFSTGYSIAESVYYAPRDYLDFAELEFENIRDSNEPMLFPLPKLLLLIAKDEKSRKGTLRKVKPYLESIRDYEYIKRTMISDLGVKQTERITLRTKKQEEDDEYECETCSANLYVSFLCDIKEDAYFCPEHALQYLQERKMLQRRNCKLYYTHSKEEISAIIKSVNQRLEDSDEEDSSSEDEMIQLPCKRISEMGRMQWTPKPKDDLLPLHGNVEVKHTSRPHRLPTTSSTRFQQCSPNSESTSPTSSTSKLSAPKVPPGTAVNVSSFSLIQHAKAKKLAASQDKPHKDKKSPESSKKSSKKSPVIPSKKVNKKDSQSSTKLGKKDKKEDIEKSKKASKNEQTSSQKKEGKKDNKSSKTKTNLGTKRKYVADDSDGQASCSESSEENSVDEAQSSDENTSSPPPVKKAKKQQAKPQKGKKTSPSTKQKKEAPTTSERRRTSGRPTKKRKAALNQSGNLTSEILDMLLSTSSDDSEEGDQGEDSSDESWK